MDIFSAIDGYSENFPLTCKLDTENIPANRVTDLYSVQDKEHGELKFLWLFHDVVGVVVNTTVTSLLLLTRVTMVNIVPHIITDIYIHLILQWNMLFKIL